VYGSFHIPIHDPGNIDYAMGKQENQQLQLSDAKVHIGYVNNF